MIITVMMACSDVRHVIVWNVLQSGYPNGMKHEFHVVEVLT